jgi:hypothetical protein
MIKLIRKDHTAGQYLGQGRESGIVRNIARSEQQSAIFAMQIGQFMLQLDMIVRVTANVARPARARADIVQRLFHRRNHLGVLAHRQVIVRTPYRDVFGTIMACETARIGVGAPIAQDVDENAVAAFRMKAINCRIENLVVVHGLTGLAE